MYFSQVHYTRKATSCASPSLCLGLYVFRLVKTGFSIYRKSCIPNHTSTSARSLYIIIILIDIIIIIIIIRVWLCGTSPQNRVAQQPTAGTADGLGVLDRVIQYHLEHQARALNAQMFAI